MKKLIFLAFAFALTACGTDPSGPGKMDPDLGVDSDNNSMDCEDGDTSTRLCGLNNRGTQNLICEDGELVPNGTCDDPDECTDGDESEACLDTVPQNITCQAGQWPEVTCEDPTSDCDDNDTRDLPCGINGQGTQGQICSNNAWTNDGICVDPDECGNGDEQVVPCGLGDSGDQDQICENGQWTDVGACVGAAECVNDQSQDVACGLNGSGTQEQLCTNGVWANEGDCVDSDVCTNNATQVGACGLNQNGEIDQLCTNGQWVNDGTCVDPDICTNGDDQSVLCGLNNRGAQLQECTGGQWVDDGACNDPDQCVDNASETITCGVNGELDRVCVNGSWNNGLCVEPCIDNETRTLDCGLNDRGVQAQVCTGAEWLNDGACADPDECTDNAVQTLENVCGLNNRGDQNQLCTLGSWANSGACVDPDECTDNDTQVLALTCGFNGRGDQNQVCTVGSWTDDSCDDPDECLTGSVSTVDCEGTDEDRTCVDGQWGLPNDTHLVEGACIHNREILTCWIQHPGSITQEPDDSETVYGRLTTDNDVVTATGLVGVQAQLCYGDATDPFTSDDADVCLPATWNPTPLGGGNEYQSDLMLPVGEYHYVYSFSGDGGTTWVYCGLGENSAPLADGATIAQPGEAEIVDPCVPVDLALFTFEVSIPTTAGPHVAEEGVNASSSFVLGFHSDPATIYSSPIGTGGAGSRSFSSNRWSVDDYYQVQVPTTGYYGIQVSWDQQRSGTGPEEFKLEWSPDGTAFTTITDYNVVGLSTAPAVWDSFSFDLPAAANNLANVWIRFTSREAGQMAGGTNRVDNIAVSGSICAP